jgi:hypothetical protein
MSNFLLHEPEAVLIHIPKTGGTSIRNGVWEKRYEGPVFGVIPGAWQGLYKFAFVRHPCDRLISAWRMFTDGTMTMPGQPFAMETRQLDLAAFIDIVIDDSIIYDERRSTFAERIRHHTIPQTHPFNCLGHADFIGRYENLDADFRHVCKVLGVDAELPRMHFTTRGLWREYMDDADIARCREFYRDDFAQFGYSTTQAGN